MKRILAVLILIGLGSYAHATKRYSYSDNCITVVVEWNKDTLGTDVIIVRLKTSASILVPDEAGCFSSDTANPIKTDFRNFSCPIYKEGKPLYIINDGVSNRFRFLPSDTLITYQWHRGAVGKSLEILSFNIEYIATDTKEYASKRKNFVHVPLTDGAAGLSISQADEVALRSRAHLEVVESQ